MAAPHNDKKKKKILEAASQLLAEKSFNEISLAQIAARAGVTKGSVYYYYKTKDDILCDVADGYLMGMYDELVAWMENKEKDTSLPRLLRYVLSRGAYDPAGGLRLHLTVDAVDGNEKIKTRLLERYRTFRITIGNAIAERRTGADADYCGWLVLTILDGLMLQVLMGNDEIDSHEFIEKFIRDFSA